MTKKVVKFKKLVPAATIPTYAHDGDIGMDVFAVSMEYDKENDVYIYHTGLACETTGHMGILGMMKSSIYKHGEAFLTNAVGLIDSDQFRGEIIFVYRNRTSLYQRIYEIQTIDGQAEINIDPYYYAPYKVGEAVGQLVPLTFDNIEIQEVIELSETERGTGGFGSSEASKKANKKLKI